MDLEGKVAIVTGADSGIGYATAKALGEHGASVVVNYHGEGGDAAALAQGLTGAGRPSLAVQADISDSRQVQALVSSTVRELGRIDVLVNNAGVERYAPLLEIREDDWDAVLGVDLKGAFLCMQACARVMKEQGGGTIVNISSIHEDHPFPGYASYCAAKGALRMLMRDAALELAPFRIRVNNVAPGAIATPINSRTMQDEAKMKALRRIIPFGRMGTPEEVAQIVLFLASDRAAYVTGSTYYVDGGMIRFPQPL